MRVAVATYPPPGHSQRPPTVPASRSIVPLNRAGES